MLYYRGYRWQVLPKTLFCHRKATMMECFLERLQESILTEQFPANVYGASSEKVSIVLVPVWNTQDRWINLISLWVALREIYRNISVYGEKTKISGIHLIGLSISPGIIQNWGFLLLSGCIKRDQWHEMGLFLLSCFSFFSSLFNICLSVCLSLPLPRRHLPAQRASF